MPAKSPREPHPVSMRAWLGLAIPSVLFAVLTNAYRSVDQYWTQGVSTEAQGAIGASIFVLILFYGLFNLVSAGASPLIARAVGAEDPDALRRALGAATAGALGLTVIVTLSGGLGAELIAEALGLEGLTASECAAYLKTISWTILPLVMTPLVDQAFISMGDARLPMVLHGLSLLLNMVLTPLLIFDAELGIAGAALASNASRAVSTGVGLWILVRRTRLGVKDLGGWSELWRVCRIGFPVTIGVATYTLVYWGMLYTSISPLGPSVNAALGIGFSALEGFTWPCFHGVSLATASFVGRHLGAGRPDLARATVRQSMPLAIGLGLGASGAFYFGGHFLTGLFTQDPAVHEAATTYAVILAASQVFVALETVLEGALNGAGDTRTVFWLSAPWNGLRIPMAWVMAFPMGMGAEGVWWAINITTYGKALMKGWVVWRGRWTSTEV